jgi:DNA-binding transcriptional LysR family regulator
MFSFRVLNLVRAKLSTTDHFPTLWCDLATIDLNLLRSFTLVYETGSFSLAAERLRVPRSTVSRAVAALEESRGTLLFHRTTRKVSPTAEGAQLYDRVKPTFGALLASLAELPERSDANSMPTGLLRITSTADIGALVLSEVTSRFVIRYPDVRVEARLSNQLVDLARDGFDLALRVSPGRLKATALIARKVGEVVFGIYASPSYLARRGSPRSSDDLQSLDWVGFAGTPPLLLRRNGMPNQVVGVRPRVVADDIAFLREALKHGVGLGLLPPFVADAELAAGTLVRVLPKVVAPAGSVFLVRPNLKQLPRRVAAFSELLLETLRRRPLSVPRDT